jgi:hypothetical protein
LHFLSENLLDQLLVYVDDDNILGGSVHTIKERSKETGIEINADKTEYRSCLEIRMQNEITV